MSDAQKVNMMLNSMILKEKTQQDKIDRRMRRAPTNDSIDDINQTFL